MVGVVVKTGAAGTAQIGYLFAERTSRRIIIDGMTVRGWIGLVEASGFQTVDVLWRDADVVIIAARKG